MNAICTIVTADYLHYAFALYESLSKQNNFIFYILITDQNINKIILEEQNKNIKILFLKDIQEERIAAQIIHKYEKIGDSTIRWALKPVLTFYLLKQHTKVLFLDADLFFFENHQFLFDELTNNNVLLTPHWRNSNPFLEEDNGKERFEILFTSGLFNAGFIGINRQGKEVMEWWANCCLYRCDINSLEGHYADQAYLNLIPIYFEKVKIINHRGCNVAEWNRIECRRTLTSNNQVKINGEYPIIFIHFTADLVKDIHNGKEPLLINHLNKWKESLNKYLYLSEPYKLQKAEQLQEEREKSKKNNEKIEKNTTFERLKQKIRIRTRILRFIQG